ncbi:AI-2E family transporter [uncultured Devosia sp.]|uniref:AI-2E family transporter n=1 Tax=uncultured Devosia sp. TaxID=211434 RepID=UPI0026033E48|nr:AI-2E family transporter [uncultured Devosia sp.]
MPAGSKSSSNRIGSPLWIARATAVAAGVVLLVWMAWSVAHVFLLLFGAIVLATVLRAAGDGVKRLTHLPTKWSLLLAELLIAAFLSVFLFLLGSQIASEFSSLAEQVPDALSAVGNRFDISVMDSLRDQASLNWLGRVLGLAPGIAGVLSSLIVVVVGGLFLAAQPEMYREGTLKLIPPAQRDALRTAVLKAGQALRLWLIGKLIAMSVIGVVTYIGLCILGVPSALALALVAGILEFIPFLGPIISFIPAALIAVAHGGVTVWWVAGLYLLIQQAENNLLVPLIQQHTVELPPVLGLFAIVMLGVLFGLLGIVFGVPLTVALMVLVKQLYLRDTLGEETHIPGEKS